MRLKVPELKNEWRSTALTECYTSQFKIWIGDD